MQKELLEQVKDLEEKLTETEKKLQRERDYRVTTVKELNETFNQLLKDSRFAVVFLHIVFLVFLPGSL